MEALDSELKSGTRNVEEAVQEQQNLSSLVWICTSTHAISKVTVIGKHYLRFQENNFDFDFFPVKLMYNLLCHIDANSPADVLESFHVCSSHLLCIASVPGAKEDDYKVDEGKNDFRFRVLITNFEILRENLLSKNLMFSFYFP